MFTSTCESRCDESMAFPSNLRSSVRAAVTLVAKGELHPPRRVFTANVDRETLQIPYRLYYSPAQLRRELSNSHGVDKLILTCLGTRHYDGYLREECLGDLLGSEDSWLTPYIIQLAGEYVVEIVDDVAKGIVLRDTLLLAAFVRENPDYIATLDRRVTSYWNCYHRQTYPDRSNYPGTKVLAYLKRVLE